MPELTPAHNLGQHVVGQRVVVRRLVRGADGQVELGPTGGPAFTDVLGVCRSWTPGGSAVIEREDGVRVEIAISDIVSGKPVPPRPSIRMRVTSREAERHSLVMWPTVERQPLGEWELRTQAHPVGRLLKRANSCLAIGDPGLPFADAESAVLDFYGSRERDALVQVEADSDVERSFLDGGWRPLDRGEAAFQLASVSHVLRTLRSDIDVHLEEDGPRVLATIGETASGRAAVDRDWLGIHGLAVEEQHRRQGLARGVMAALLEWGAQQGARTAWLHVETDNEPALALYESLGFVTHHVCRYLTPGD